MVALPAVAFWVFLTAIVVAGVWYGLREKQAQYDMLARMIEGGKPIDEKLVDKILSGKTRPDRGLKIGGIITLFAAPGLVVMGWFLSRINENVMAPLLAVGGLAAFVGVGLLVAGRFAERSLREDEKTDLR